MRYLEEVSPTYDIINPRYTYEARQQEFDVDRSGNGSYNMVFGNTKFNTVRVGYTYEKNGFTNRDVQANPPVALVDLPPTFSMLTFTDKTRNGALFRINNAYEISDTLLAVHPQLARGEQRLQGRASSTSTRRSSCRTRPT